MVRDGHDDAVVLVHILAVRQGDGDFSGLADGHASVLNGPPGFVVLHLDRQGPAVPIGVLPAPGGLAVLVGGPGGAGDRELARFVRLAAAVIAVLVGDGNRHIRDGALVFHKLDGNGGLVSVVQQAAVRQTDRQGIVFMERNERAGNGIFGVRVGHGDEIAAHNSLAPAVRGGLIVDFFNRFRVGDFTAVFTFPVLAALAVRGRLLVNDPVAGLVARGLGIVALVVVAAAGAGKDGEAHLRTGGGGHFLLIVVAQGLFYDGPALGTELGIGAGGRLAGDVARRLVALDAVIPAAGTAVFHDALARAGGVRDFGPLVPAMAQRVRVVRHKGAAAAFAAVDGPAARLTGGGNGGGLVLVRQRRGDVLNMPVPADLALPDRIAGAGTGGRHRIGGIGVLPLGGGGHFHLAAAGTEVQQLAVRLTVSLPDHNALPRMAQGRLIVPLLDFAALRTQVTVIAQGQAGGRGAVQ